MGGQDVINIEESPKAHEESENDPGQLLENRDLGINRRDSAMSEDK
jgi:hypothetical protein